MILNRVLEILGVKMWTRISKSVASGRTTDRGSTLGRDIDFPLRHPVQIDTGANLSFWQWILGAPSLEVNLMDHECKPSPQLSSEIKNSTSFTCTPTFVLIS